MSKFLVQAPDGGKTVVMAQVNIGIKGDKGDKGDAGNYYNSRALNRGVAGVSPLLVDEFMLPAGTYTVFTAAFGTSLETTIATLDIKKPDGTVIKTLTRTGTPLQVATDGFVLATDTLVGFYLHGDLTTTQSYIFNLGIY